MIIYLIMQDNYFMEDGYTPIKAFTNKTEAEDFCHKNNQEVAKKIEENNCNKYENLYYEITEIELI